MSRRAVEESRLVDPIPPFPPGLTSSRGETRVVPKWVVAEGEKERKGKLFYFSASKVKYIGDLGNERPFPDFPCRAPPLVID